MQLRGPLISPESPEGGVPAWIKILSYLDDSGLLFLSP